MRVLGGKFAVKNGNCAGLRSCVNKQIFDHCAQKKHPTWRSFWINEKCSNCPLSLATTLDKVCINKIMLGDTINKVYSKP